MSVKLSSLAVSPVPRPSRASAMSGVPAPPDISVTTTVIPAGSSSPNPQLKVRLIFSPYVPVVFAVISAIVSSPPLTAAPMGRLIFALIASTTFAQTRVSVSPLTTAAVTSSPAT